MRSNGFHGECQQQQQQQQRRSRRQTIIRCIPKRPKPLTSNRFSYSSNLGWLLALSLAVIGCFIPSQHLCECTDRDSSGSCVKWNAAKMTGGVAYAEPSFNEYDDDEGDDNDELLAEILAEGKREEEELAQLEAEMRELDALKAKQQQEQQEQQSKSKMKPGRPSDTTMPSGAKSKNFDNMEEQLRQKEAEAQESKRKAEQSRKEEIERKRAEEVAAKREAMYQAELSKLTDAAEKKRLKREKARDAKIVKKVLRNSANGRHYAVLGMTCRWGEIHIFGPLKLCKTSNVQIKRAYRNLAKAIHPDKNRDGRANEAFDALERSASVLTDSKLKGEYELTLKRQRKEALDKSLRSLGSLWNAAATLWNAVKKVLGPFATPIVILLVIVI